MRAVLQRLLALSAPVLTAVFPFWAWYGLRHFDLGAAAAGLAIIAALRASAHPTGTNLLQAAIAALLAAAAFLTKSASAVLLYPVLMNGFFLWIFASSLRPARTPIVERLARLKAPLPPEGARWCRGVTKAWVIFFIVNGSLALATVVANDRNLWLAWNGCGSYIAMGGMFAGEWLLRRRKLGRKKSGSS